MSAPGWLLTLVATFGLVALGDLISEQIRVRLDRIPYALLRVAIRRLPLEIRADVGDEWEAELHEILRGKRAYPVTRLFFGFRYVLGLLRCASTIGKELLDVRSRGPVGVPYRRKRVVSGLLNNAGVWIWRRRHHSPALVAGIVITLQSDWWIGLPASLIITLAIACYRNLATPVVPPENRARAARRRTRRRLWRLDPVEYICLHQCAIPGTLETIDHLIVGRNGVYALSSEWWDRRLVVSTSMGRIYHGSFSKVRVLKQAHDQAAKAAQLLGMALDAPIDVQPGIVIYGPRIPWRILSLLGVDVVGPGSLRRWLRSSRPAFSRVDAQLLGAAAARVFPHGARVTLPEALRRDLTPAREHQG